VIEELVERGATTLVTSHLGDLKRLDAEGSGVVNASLQFDAERMEPTYRFVKGRPGRSYGLAIARRLGFPRSVLDRAEAYRGGDAAADAEDALARLELQEQRAEAQGQELGVERARAQRMLADVEAREAALRAAEGSAADRAKQDARKLLMGARSEVDAAIEELREAIARGDAFDSAARAARRRVEEAAGRPVDTTENADAARGSDLDAGDRVRIHATGARGTVVELRAGRAVVEVGSLRVELPVEDLRVVDGPPADEAPRPRGGWRGPPREQVRTEVDLRGLRVDEVGIELSRALDQAVLEDLSELRIIHGMGTGALRKRVGELLEQDGRVRAFRLGGRGEGGAGVTVVTFGEPE
jgi:DNA mismatch repair protein MutS2